MTTQINQRHDMCSAADEQVRNIRIRSKCMHTHCGHACSRPFHNLISTEALRRSRPEVKQTQVTCQYSTVTQLMHIRSSPQRWSSNGITASILLFKRSPRAESHSRCFCKSEKTRLVSSNVHVQRLSESMLATTAQCFRLLSMQACS